MNTKHTAFKPIALSLLVSGLMYNAATQHATASDLQIYKPPEGGKATVVLMMDTSGSMSAVAIEAIVADTKATIARYQGFLAEGYTRLNNGTLITDAIKQQQQFLEDDYKSLAEACDLSVDGKTITLSKTGTNTATSYERLTCNAEVTTTETKTIYSYMRTGGFGNRKWFACLPNTEVMSSGNCNIPLSGEPNRIDDFDRTSSTDPRFYYKNLRVTATDNLGSNPDRITRLKDALFETLDKKDTEGNYVLGENVLMGLGQYSVGGSGRAGRMILPALPITAKHRADLKATIASLVGQGGTPTAHAYAEAAAYLMGTTTGGGTYSGFEDSVSSTKDGDKYKAPFQTGVEAATCDGQGVYVLTDGIPNGSSTTRASDVMKFALDGSELGTSTPALTGGSTAGAWTEVGHFARRLRDKTKNPAEFKILTAVVGFGSTFNGATVAPVNGKTYYDCSTISGADARNACNWGAKALYRKGSGTTATYAAANKDGSIPEGYSATDLISGGYGEGGFYPASRTEEVVQSIIDFVSDLNGDIPPVPTGSIIIPQDTLAPDSLQRFAYVPALLTQPSDPVVVWRGNLKKYKVDNGTIYGNAGTNQLVFDDKGSFNKETSDFWGSSTVADKGDVQTGGMFDKIPYKTTKEGSVERSVWVQTTGTTLTKVQATKASLDGLGLGNYAARKILNYMGYPVDGLEDAPIDTITAPETPLRSLGGVVHSTPQLLTYGAEFDDDGQLKEDRDDYLLFGSMEGGLHLVDAGTGVEKFVFLPKAMITRQPRALLEGTEGSLDGVTSRSKTGSPPMYFPAYGIDAPWTAYAEYARAGAVGTTSSKISATKMYAYGGLRMGGAGFYGMNLTDKDDPKLMFAIEEGATGFARLGQTWGKPVVTRIRYNNKPHLVVVISGGYDEKYENPTFKASATSPAKGNAVYIVSAETANGVAAGTLLYSIAASGGTSNNSNIIHSIVGRVKTLDRDSDGLTDHLYFADLGGQVFRTDINNIVADPKDDKKDDATIRRTELLATLSNTDGSLPRFYEAPTVTIHDEDGKRFGMVNVASGDRSNPLYGEASDTGTTGLTPNRVYGLIDRDVARVDLYSTSSSLTMRSSGINIGKLLEKSATLTLPTARTAMLSDSMETRKEGWYANLNRYGSSTADVKGLKAFSEPAAIRNDLYVSVYNPNVTDSTASKCDAKVVGASELHRYCLPFGVCAVTQGEDADVRFALGKGIQSVNIGPGEEGNTRRIIYQQPTSQVKNVVTGNALQNSEYKAPPRLVPIRWYEKQPKLPE